VSSAAMRGKSPSPRGVAVVVIVGILGALLGFSFYLRPSKAAATPEKGRCGGTVVRSDGRLPAWTATAHPPSGVPYAISKQGNVAAILFGNPLRSGHPTDRSNKILWIVRAPRNGHPLHLTARLLHVTSPTLRIAEEAGSAPGEIYPSVVDVPTPGCWHLTLDWDGNHAALDLRYS
jgi:hypothetical protein